MPRRLTPLPTTLQIPFRTGDAGLTTRRVRGADLSTPTRGARLLAGMTSLRDRCLALSLVLPAATVFSHTTAARLLGLPLPWWTDDLVHAIVPHGTQARRRGLTAHRHTLAAKDVVVVDGVRATSPGRTFCDLAEMLDIGALVAVGDHIAHRLPVEAIEQVLARYRARRGRRILRMALALIDGRAESPKETELRLLLVEAGFGPFEVQHEIFDARGDFIARVDLALRAARIVVEYEGDHHRDREQWRRDVARRRRLEAAGWIYIPVTQADLRDPRQLFADLRAALASRTPATPATP